MGGHLATEEVTAMLAAFGVVLLGLAIGALGLITPTMYDVAVVVVFIGLIGIAVRALDLARWIRS
jgi:hypothetical protein